jgi:hypothetical protein
MPSWRYLRSPILRRKATGFLDPACFEPAQARGGSVRIACIERGHWGASKRPRAASIALRPSGVTRLRECRKDRLAPIAPAKTSGADKPM